MYKKYLCIFSLTLCAIVALSRPGYALTAVELHALQRQGTDVTIIDIRRQSEYTQGHIPGAVNIPAQLLALRKLPSLDRVVIYGDGIHLLDEQTAVDALKKNKTLTVDLLKGGFAAWQESHLPTTGKKGVSRPKTALLSFAEVQKLHENEKKLVFVDVRRGKSESRGRADVPENRGAMESVADIFPGASEIRLEKVKDKGKDKSYKMDRIVAEASQADGTLFVLLDDGDGKAEELAMKLKASGVHRICILIGGDIALQKRGRSEKKTVIRENSL